MSSLRRHRFAVAPDLTIAAEIGGDPSAPAVMLMHGGGQTRHAWRNAMLELLAHNYYVVNLDARGHGDSGWPQDAEYSVEAMSADIRAVIDALGCAPPALVGASMGGMAALHLAGTCGNSSISALVLVDVVPRVESAGVVKIGAFMHAHPDGFASLEEAADAVAAYNPRRPRPSDPAGLMKNLRLRDNGRWYWHWDPRFAQSTKLLGPKVTELMLNAARNVRVPSLLVRGLQSDIVGDRGVEELKQALPSLETYDVASAGHMVAGDKNDAFNRTVIGFLRRHLPIAKP